MAKTNDFTADSVQIGSIKRSLSESSDGDLVFSDKFYPGGVRLRDIGQFNVALKIDAIPEADEDNIIVFSADGKLKDSGIKIENIASAFVQLSDTPETFGTGTSGQFVKVNTSGNGLIFETVNIDGLQTQITINTNSITSLNTLVNINSDYVNDFIVPSLEALSGKADNFLELDDTPSTYPTSAGNYAVRVNGTSTGLEYFDILTPLSAITDSVNAINNSQTFLDLDDTPDDFVDTYLPQVSGDKLVFVPFTDFATDIETILSNEFTTNNLTVNNDVNVTGDLNVADISAGNVTVDSLTINGNFDVNDLTVNSISGVDAYMVDYDNTGSGLSSANVETALSELDHDISAITATVRGQDTLNTSDLIYSINYGDTITGSPVPLVTLVSPTSGGSTYVESIFDVTDTGFQVELNQVPATSGYKLNWSVDRANFSKGEDTNEKIFDISDVVLPSTDPATLDTASTASGWEFYTIDFLPSEVGYFNFTMSDQFKNNGYIEVDLTFTADVAGNCAFGIRFDEIKEGDIYSASTPSPIVYDTVTVSTPGEVVKVTYSISAPTYHNIEVGDLVIMQMKRLVGGSFGANPARVLGAKIRW